MNAPELAASKIIPLATYLPEAAEGYAHQTGRMFCANIVQNRETLAVKAREDD